MRPSFNTSGPCFPDEHYMVPPERRLGRALELIEEGKYFTLTAGRQTGKTTSLFWLVEHLNAGGKYLAMWVDLQAARENPDPATAFRTLLGKLDRTIKRDLPDAPRPPDIEPFLVDPATALENYLADLAARSSKPLVVLFDEADGLIGPTMVSFLTQLRDGYIARRRAPFPHSVALVGMREVRDYALSEEDRRAVSWLGTTSPFNITAESLKLSSFSSTDVEELLTQHTAATGQVFLPEARERIFQLGEGHPWLTNALADQIVNRDVRERSTSITAAHVDAAKETLILERRTHIDSLMARLREPRVRKVIDAMIAGRALPDELLDDDLAYVVGLGLVRRQGGEIRIANGVYQEVIPRALTYMKQTSIHEQPERFVRADGSLDMPKLMREWQIFWREDGHVAAEGFQYRESGPHLMLMAFLQRIVNGGGRIRREYGLGRNALDILVEWRAERHAIELKVRRDTETEERALSQVSGYLDSLGLAEGWLVMFDLRSTRPWEERLWNKDVTRPGKLIHVVGC